MPPARRATAAAVHREAGSVPQGRAAIERLGRSRRPPAACRPRRDRSAARWEATNPARPPARCARSPSGGRRFRGTASPFRHPRAQHCRGTTPGRRATTGASGALVRPAPQDPARRVHQRIGDGVGPEVRGRRLLLAPAVPGPDQDAARARGARQGHVAPLVADHDRAFQVEAQQAHRVEAPRKQPQADRTNAIGQAAGRRRRLPTPAAPFARHRSAGVPSRVDACLQKEGTETCEQERDEPRPRSRFRRASHRISSGRDATL